MDPSARAMRIAPRGKETVRSRSSSGISPVRISAMRLLCRAQCAREHIIQPSGLLEPDADAHELGRHAVPRGPIELPIVREDRVRAREGEVGAEAGALGARERVEEPPCCALAGEREREQPAEAAGGQSAARGVVLRGLPFRVEDFGDG